MPIIKAMVAREHDPVRLAKMRDPRVKRSAETIGKALEGDYRQEHLFALRQAVELYETYQRQIQGSDRHIEVYLATVDSKVEDKGLPPSRGIRRKPLGNIPHLDLRSHLYRFSGVDFTQIDGLDALSLCNLLSDVRLDPRALPTVKHFTSWLALCPNIALLELESRAAPHGRPKTELQEPFVSLQCHWPIAPVGLEDISDECGSVLDRQRQSLPLLINSHGYFISCGKLENPIMIPEQVIMSKNIEGAFFQT
jgi:hypothetical protein